MPEVNLEALEDRIVCAFSDRAILQLDIHEDDPRLSQICDEVRDEVVRPILAALRTPDDGDGLVDPKPEIVGHPLAKTMSYNDAHEDAVAMGYPSLTEALEHLDELRQRPDAAVVEALEEIARADVGLQALDESYREKGRETPWMERAKYFMRQVERRREIARKALSQKDKGRDS